jgi:hypothetical protein
MENSLKKMAVEVQELVNNEILRRMISDGQ